MSSTCWAMIESIIERSERARTTQIGQPPAAIAALRRTSTMSRAGSSDTVGRPSLVVTGPPGS